MNIASNLANASAALRAERDENTCRKMMPFSEMLPLKHAIEALERQRAQERKVGMGRSHGRGQIGSVNLTEPIGSRSERESRTVVAKALGKSNTTMDKVEHVYKVAAHLNRVRDRLEMD